MAEDKRQTLHIPHGTIFELRDGKLVWGHDGDIVITGNMGGHRLQRIFSKRGSVQLIPPEGTEIEVDEVEAPMGDIFLNGRVRARHVRGKTIHFQEGSLVAEHLEAAEEAVLTGQRLDVLRVKAPRVQIEGEAQGTCLVIESQNDVGRIRCRGGFRSMDEAKHAIERFQRSLGEATAGATQEVRAAALEEPAPARRDTGSTDEFRASVHAPTPAPGPDAPTAPVLPKSSVFRKRT
jgi:hypothetical protein